MRIQSTDYSLYLLLDEQLLLRATKIEGELLPATKQNNQILIIAKKQYKKQKTDFLKEDYGH